MKLSGPDAPDHEQRRAKGKRLGRPRVIVDAARIGRLHEAGRKFLSIVGEVVRLYHHGRSCLHISRRSQGWRTTPNR